MAEVLDIQTHRFKEGDRLFLDTNVWLGLLMPQAQTAFPVEVYSKAYGQILTAGAKLYIDEIVLSEYTNRFAQLAHKTSRFSRLRPKEFRNHPEFEKVRNTITVTLRKIMRQATLMQALPAMDWVLGEFEIRGSDFNDLILAEKCRKAEVTMISHDADMKRYAITLVTANPNAFKSEM